MIDLYNGECLEVMDKLIEQGIVFDSIITDPPYGTTACKWDSVIPFEDMWKRLNKLIKPNGAIVMTASQPFTTSLIASKIDLFKYCWYWNKNRVTGVLNAKHQPLRCVEEVVVFCDGKSAYYPQGVVECKKITSTGNSGNGNSDNYGQVKEGDYLQTQTGYPKQILNVQSAVSTQHPTQKPVKLMEYLIKTYTLKNELILDFTMGSGTTGVACMNTNRKFVGIEMDENYFNIAKKRIEEARDLPIQLELF